MYIVIEHSTECPTQNASVSNILATHDDAIEEIVQRMNDNCEMEDGVPSGYSISVPDDDVQLDNESEIRAELEHVDSVVVDHGFYFVRYDIVEIQ